MFIQLGMYVGRNDGLKTPSPFPTLGNSSVITEGLTAFEIHTKIEEMGKAAKLVKDVGYQRGHTRHALGTSFGFLCPCFYESVRGRVRQRLDRRLGTAEERRRLDFARLCDQSLTSIFLCPVGVLWNAHRLFYWFFSMALINSFTVFDGSFAYMIPYGIVKSHATGSVTSEG